MSERHPTKAPPVTMQIESHKRSNSVTLKVGHVTAHISAGGSWKDANDAAHMLGRMLVGKAKAEDVYAKLQQTEHALDDFSAALASAGLHLRQIAGYHE